MQQITNTILMVRPAHFGYDEETADNNAFQFNDPTLSTKAVEKKAIEEFDQFVAKLRAHGVQILVIEDTDTPKKLDAVFPNNWFSTHENGALVTYPLYAPNRRAERREDLLANLAKDFQINQRINLETFEADQLYLEGTGSLILDRPNYIAYACRSVRTDERLFQYFCERFDFEPFLFHAEDDLGQPIYHTNVMMALGDTFVVIALETIQNTFERNKLVKQFAKTGKDIIEISLEQMKSFAGNMLQVCNTKGDRFLVMSSQAYKSLSSEQLKQIEQHCPIIHSPLDTLETYGGGSARCMMAEIFLPQLV